MYQKQHENIIITTNLCIHLSQTTQKQHDKPQNRTNAEQCNKGTIKKQQLLLNISGATTMQQTHEVKSQII